MVIEGAAQSGSAGHKYLRGVDSRARRILPGKFSFYTKLYTKSAATLPDTPAHWKRIHLDAESPRQNAMNAWIAVTRRRGGHTVGRC